MGAIWSRFRKKTSTIEVLEQLEQEIKKLEQFRRQNQEAQKWFIARLLLYSILMYIVSALIFYFYYFPDKWKERLLYSIPLLIFPLIIWLVKKGLHWYFVKRIAKNDTALEERREKKKQILEDVMENETYKKAKEILEKFDPARYKQLEPPKISPLKPSPGTDLRQRPMPHTPGSQLRPGLTPGPSGMTPIRPGSGMRPGMTPYGPRGSVPGMQPRNLMSSGQRNGTPIGPQLPRPIPPRDRGTVDKLLEYLVGDGPTNRYALICAACFAHNGMAMKEEFEYISFRCCYCTYMNQARKKRPFAPRIEPPPVQTTASKHDSADESESDDDDDENDGASDNDNHNNQTGNEEDNGADADLISEDDDDISEDGDGERPREGGVVSDGNGKVDDDNEESMEVEDEGK